MPSRSSSQAVSRAPCRSGRVSSTQTAARRPARMRGGDDADRRADAGGGERAGVAVREHAVAGREEPGAVLRHPPVAIDVLGVQGARPFEQRRRDLRQRPRRRLRSSSKASSPCSSAQRRFTAVGRVWPSSARARSKRRAGSGSGSSGSSQRERQPVGRGDADRRRAAHREAPDGVGHLLDAPVRRSTAPRAAGASGRAARGRPSQPGAPARTPEGRSRAVILMPALW